MRKFTFFIEEYDQQGSFTKYYKTHSYGINFEHAFNRISLPRQEGYGYKLLTLNQFNSLKKKPNLCTIIWETLVALYPFKISIKH